MFPAECPTVLPAALADTDKVAVMLNHDISEIATFDEGFDRVDGIARVRLA